LKADGHLERHANAGTCGRTYGVMMAAIGHNLRLLLAWLKTFLRAMIFSLIATITPHSLLEATLEAT
jgi:IS5 family transposase